MMRPGFLPMEYFLRLPGFVSFMLAPPYKDVHHIFSFSSFLVLCSGRIAVGAEARGDLRMLARHGVLTVGICDGEARPALDRDSRLSGSGSGQSSFCLLPTHCPETFTLAPHARRHSTCSTLTLKTCQASPAQSPRSGRVCAATPWRATAELPAPGATAALASPGSLTRLSPLGAPTLCCSPRLQTCRCWGHGVARVTGDGVHAATLAASDRQMHAGKYQ
jgi:hypothetical protein